MDRFILHLLLLVLSCEALQAQDSKEVLKGNADKAQGMFDGGFRKGSAHGTTKTADSTAWELIDPEMSPEFPGGTLAYMEYVQKTMTTLALDSSCVSTKVFVEVVVDSIGNVLEPRIKRGGCPAYDDTILHMMQSMPRWKPGTLYGRPKSTRMILPVQICRR